MKEPKAGDTIYCSDPAGPQGPGMVIAVTRAAFTSTWDGKQFSIVPSTDEYLVEIAFSEGVRLIGRAHIKQRPTTPSGGGAGK